MVNRLKVPDINLDVFLMVGVLIIILAIIHTVFDHDFYDHVNFGGENRQSA